MTSLLKQTLGGLTEVSALLLKYDGSLAQYALISHQIDALSVQTTKLVENTQKQVLDRNDVWVPMYGPNHVARVDSAREELARLVLEFELLVRPVDKEEKVAKEEVPVVFAQPRIVQQSLAAQRLAVDQQARNNLALAQQAKNRVKKDAVDLEMARMAPGGGELRSFEELAGLLTTDARLALGAILEEICRRPENAQFRTLKTSNAAVAALLESSEWMRPALRSLGFGPKFVPLRDHREDEEETLAYFLPEPNLDTDFDAWLEETYRTLPRSTQNHDVRLRAGERLEQMRSFLVQNIPYDCGQDRLFAIFSQFGSLYPSSVYFINRGCAFIDFWKESLVLEHGTEITCEGRVLIWEELVVNLNLASRPSSLSSSCGARLAIDETKLPAIHVMERSSPSSSMLSSSSATNGSLHSSEEDAATTVLKPTKVRVANLPLDATEEQVRRALLVWGKLRSFRWEPDHPPLILATFEFSENPPNRLFLEELLSGFGVARGEGDRELVVGPMLKRTALVSITKLLGERFGAAVRMSKTSPVPAPTLHKSCLAVFADDKAAHSACHSGVTVSGALFSCTKV